LTFPASTPASIGGKLNPSGTVVSSATDQFNGAVANVWANRLPVTPPPNQPPPPTQINTGRRLATASRQPRGMAHRLDR
jgi:hypothetical protein